MSQVILFCLATQNAEREQLANTDGFINAASPIEKIPPFVTLQVVQLCLSHWGLLKGNDE
jgi:hypothetical protein